MKNKFKNSFYSVTLRSIVCKIAVKLIIHHPIQPNTIGQKYTLPRLYLKPYLGEKNFGPYISLTFMVTINTYIGHPNTYLNKWFVIKYLYDLMCQLL